MARSWVEEYPTEDCDPTQRFEDLRSIDVALAAARALVKEKT